MADGGTRGRDSPDLVRRAARGDAAAFEILYRGHCSRVFAICQRLTRDPALAEDCTQDTFVRAWRALPRFEARSAFGTWLHRIAVNVVLERRRRALPPVEFVDELPLERLDVRKDGDRLVVRAVLRRGASQRDGKADLELSVPRSVRLEVSTVSAGVDVAEVGGEQRLNSVSGDIRLDGGGASTEVKTVSGDVLLRGSEQATALRIATVSGDVRIERGGGSLEANTVSGDLRLGLGAIRSLRLRSTSGDIEVRATAERGARVEAESVSGDVDLSLVAPAGIELEAESFSGAIVSCFGARGEATRTPSPGRSLRSVRGDGGSQVRIKTMSGDIDVCDR